MGRGEPAIFLHAADISGWTWRKVIPKLAEHITCYNIDMPGFDHSDVPPRKYSIEDFTQSVVDVMDSAGLKLTNIIADHTGSMVAVDLAGTHPHRVGKMVLDGLPYWDAEGGRAYFENSFVPRHTDLTSYDIHVEPMLTWEEAVARHPSNANREIWAKREEIKRKSRLWTRLCQEANTGYDVVEAGAKVRAPTLLIYGQSDMVRFSGEQARAPAPEAIKGSVLRVFPGAPGSAHQHDPEEFTRQALDFLLEHP